jgi:Xaa-Pro aminopeptidase
MNELERKLNQIRKLLTERQLDALLLNRVSSFAWATCGAASYVNTAASDGAGTLLITQDSRYLITNSIEAPRFEREEKLAEQGWTLCAAPWHETNPALAELTAGLRMGADGPYPGAIDLSAEISRLRSQLGPEEGQRFRVLGRLCAEAMNSAIRSIRPGMTEYEIAGRLAEAVESRGVQAVVNLIATDERIFAYRHPLPTDKTLDRYAMLVLCGRRHGLVCSLTRLVHFGPMPTDLHRKAEAVAQVDAAMIAATRPGRTLGDVFATAVATYKATGYGDEWRLHHGGPAGYEPRESIATPGSTDPVLAGQAFAWNPSITGTKSEDTILVSEHGNEVLTSIPGWPMLEVSADGLILPRPAVLEVF